MASPLLEIVGALLGGGALGTLGKGWLDRRKGQDQLAASSEKAYYAGLEARIAKLEVREDELQEELKLRIEREGEQATRIALLERENTELRSANDRLRERVRLDERAREELREENEELRQVVDVLRERNASLSSELMTLRGGKDQLATVQFTAPEGK